jgi:hypothetical protein
VNSPTVLAARGDRTIVYDSGNQRLVKLRLDRRPAAGSTDVGTHH